MYQRTEPELVLDGRGPIRRQIEEQIQDLILTGALEPGEELPTVRELAVGLAVEPHTVEQAYQALERDGFLSPGDQRVVAPRSSQTHEELRRLCRDFLRRTAECGYSLAEVLHAVHGCIAEG
jgi:GntR family transcriptional regulator